MTHFKQNLRKQKEFKMHLYFYTNGEIQYVAVKWIQLE